MSPPLWKCPGCGWTGDEPFVYYRPADLEQPIDVFCPINCGKGPEFLGDDEARIEWWNEWYRRQG